MTTSNTITKTDLTNILNEVLPPVGSAILYNGSKVSSGTITLADAYTNYDFLIVSYFVNVDRYSRVFDCSQISANPTHNFDGDIASYASNFSYQSNCSFKPTDSTHLAVSNSGNNVNFVAGIVKIVGVISSDSRSGIAIDYIIEQGTSGDWTYRKWNSGIYECWTKYTKSVSANSIDVSTYLSYPITFTAEPNVTMGLLAGGADLYRASIISATTTQVRLCLINNYSSAVTLGANLYVKGTWK